MDRYPANESSETDLDVDEGKALLKVHNEGRVNRLLATQEQVGHTSFRAVLSRVHYGLYSNEPACLISLGFSFRFRSKT